jgi:phage head maturation protease
MTLTMDSLGIHYTATIDTRVSYAKDVAVAVERGDIKGNSFSFRALKDSYSEKNNVLVRSILDAELLELSCTSLPAYKSSTLNIRAACPPELRHLLAQKMQMRDETLGLPCWKLPSAKPVTNPQTTLGS